MEWVLEFFERMLPVCKPDSVVARSICYSGNPPPKAYSAVTGRFWVVGSRLDALVYVFPHLFEEFSLFLIFFLLFCLVCSRFLRSPSFSPVRSIWFSESEGRSN
jgi:hypothetical protein